MLQFEGACWARLNTWLRMSCGTGSGKKPRTERRASTASSRLQFAAGAAGGDAACGFVDIVIILCASPFPTQLLNPAGGSVLKGCLPVRL
jgi:hypothetical protein